jgi:hypothetical protein
MTEKKTFLFVQDTDEREDNKEQKDAGGDSEDWK